MQSRDTESYDNSAENSHLQCRNTQRCRCRVHSHRLNSALSGYKRAYCRIHNQICYCTRQCGNFFLFFSHTYGNTHCKEQRKVIKHYASRLAHNIKNCVEQTALINNLRKTVCFKRCRICKRASYTEQQTGNRQKCYRQHK